MSLFSWITNIFNTDNDARTIDDRAIGHPSINPANGLPMIGSVDVEGNPYGTDYSHQNQSSSGLDDIFSSSNSFSHDDTWSSSSSSNVNDCWSSSSNGGMSDW